MPDEIIIRLRKATRIPVRRIYGSKTGSHRIGTCEGCRMENVLTTKHHLIPTAIADGWERKALSDHGRIKLTVKLCEVCHMRIHQLFTNSQLAKMTREEQLAAL
jgi:hypothetical protein